MSLPSQVDVLVAGSGAAGLTAALAAAANGSSVLLVERGEHLGGTTALSGGRVWVPGNHLQDGDSLAAAQGYLTGVFSGRYPEMTGTFLRTAPEMLRFVESHSAHRFAACPGYPDYHQGRPGATTGGRALDMVPIGIRRLTPLAADILTPPGYLPLSFAEWDSWRYPDRYDWDPDLRAKYQPAAQRASGAPPTNTGDGLRIATEAGAGTDNLAEGWWMPMLAIPGETLLGEQFYRSLIRERGLPRQIMVNAAGRRFVNEALPYNEIGKALHTQDTPAFLIFDEDYLSRYPMPGMSLNGPPPAWVASGATLAELAGRIAADPAALASTVRRWNESCAAGADPDFGRGQDAYQRFCGDPEVRPNPSLGPLDRPPYYAVEVLAGTIGTKGGPVTDINGVVQRADGSPVPGLYAAGNAAAFWTADGYPGPGATLAVGMTMGYRAGRHAAVTVR